MTATRKFVTFAMVAFVLCVTLALFSLTSGADAGMRCTDNSHYHPLLNQTHHVHKSTQVGPNEIKDYWYSHDYYDWGTAHRFLGTKIC